MVVVYSRSADADTMQAYAKLALPALFAYGGRFVVRAPAGTAEPREHGLTERVVILEFPSKAEAVAAYDSEAYQAAMLLLQGKAERDVRFVDGHTPTEASG